MDVTRLAGVALASALMFSCASRAAPGAAASTPDPGGAPPPASVHEVPPEAVEGLPEDFEVPPEDVEGLAEDVVEGVDEGGG